MREPLLTLAPGEKYEVASAANEMFAALDSGAVPRGGKQSVCRSTLSLPRFAARITGTLAPNQRFAAIARSLT